MTASRHLWPFVAAMAIVVVASNVLVQFPVGGHLGSVALADILTWGAFTYPVAFLVTDLANRRYGPSTARRVVFVGFMTAVATTMVFPSLLFHAGLIPFETEAGRLARIAVASGSAFLVGQLLDVTLFNWLRRQSWWRAPVIGSVAGSVIDTIVFFNIAFAPFFAFIGPNDAFSLEIAPLMGTLAMDAPRWISWALGDLSVKLLIAVFALIPYRIIAAGWRQPVPA
jgi:uncharacterized integral membrane protein (TIGR00697 family)